MTRTNADGVGEILREVRRIEVQVARFARDALSGGYHAVFRGAGVEFADVREAVAGDERRAIDPRVTARMGRPFVRRFVDERELRLVFVLDVSAAMDAGFGVLSLRAAAARVAASLALVAVETGDRVGLLAHGGGAPLWVAPAKGRRHALRVVGELVSAPGGARPELALALATLLRVQRRRAIVVVLSDFAAPLPEREFAAVARRHDVVAVHLLPPESVGLPRTLVRFADPVGGSVRLVDGSSEVVRASYAAAIARALAEVKSAIARARVDRIAVPVPADGDVDALLQPVARYFERHGRARGRR